MTGKPEIGSGETYPFGQTMAGFIGLLTGVLAVGYWIDIGRKEEHARWLATADELTAEPAHAEFSESFSEKPKAPATTKITQ